jgi:UDP-galactopyranose mutase
MTFLPSSLRPSQSSSATSAKTTRQLLICFSHLRWNFVLQRPQHLLGRAARSQPVIFFEEPIMEPDARAHLRLETPQAGVTVATPILPSCLTQRECDLFQRSLLSDLLAQHDISDSQQRERLITWYFTPMPLRFSAHLQPAVCVYDCMDELSQFAGAPHELRDLERQLMARANVMFTGGHSLYESKRNLHRNVHPFPSSIDVAHFGQARRHEGSEPADQVGIGPNRVGFFGVIDERFDAGLVDEVARLRPDWNLVMIGPVVKIDPASLPQRSNIHWLGQKSYHDLPAYLSGWDLGLMPFALNEATRFISPTKTPEFLAAGLPVISTAVPDVVRTYGAARLVEIAMDAADVVALAEMLMARPRTDWLARVDALLETTSWDRTWSSMAALIEQQRRARASTGKVVAMPAQSGSVQPLSPSTGSGQPPAGQAMTSSAGLAKSGLAAPLKQVGLSQSAEGVA